MTKIELINFEARAIIGDIRNMSLDCIERPRPRVQYMHFWRGIKRKINEVSIDNTLLSTQLSETISGLKKILDAYEKPQNTDSREISTKCLEYLGITPEENE